jgi:uncharacterized membrane protein
MNVSKECLNKTRRFCMIDNEISVRILPGENPKEVAETFKKYYLADYVDVYDEYGNRVLATA